MNVPFVDLKAQYRSLQPQMDAAIADVIANTAFIGGQRVADFEAAFASYVGMPHCVSVANGTEAIEIALWAFGIGEGDEVIVPANSFIASSEAVTATGATVVFADSDPATYTLNPEEFRRKITSRTKAVLPVHLYGHPADMDPIMAIASEHGLIVIEDASQAHGARYKGRMVGSIGDAATFSFYPGKNLGAYGDAGGIIFRDGEIAERARLFANHGSRKKYIHEIEGRNSRLDGIQAAVLSIKLPHLDSWNAARRKNAALYNQLLANIEGITIPVTADWGDHVFHLYVIRVPEREELANFLSERGISTGIHYPISLPMAEAYSHYHHSIDDFPVANGQMSQLLSLPMYAELTEEMIYYVASAIREWAAIAIMNN